MRQEGLTALLEPTPIFTSNKSFAGACAIAAASLFSSAASANIIMVSDGALFGDIVAGSGGSLDHEFFAGYSGYYGSGLAGGTGNGAWTASASGGLYADGGIMSTNFGGEALTLSFASADVFAIGGNFFNTAADFSTTPSLIQVQVNNISYVFFADGNDFSGFISTSGAIQAITFTPYGSGSASKFASTDHVVVGAIPSPAALALGALAGLIRRRRR